MSMAGIVEPVASAIPTMLSGVPAITPISTIMKQSTV
jgi:hypothetical protein